MRLVPATAGRPQAVLHIVAKFCCCATFAAAQGYSHRLHLSPRLQCVGVVSLHAYAVRAAQWVGAKRTGLDGKADRLHHYRGAAVVDVPWRPSAKTLRSLIEARNFLYCRVSAVDGDPDRHQRRAPPRSILAGVEAFAAQRVGRLNKERFRFKVHPPAGAGACVASRGHVNGAALVVAAVCDWNQAVSRINICAWWPVTAGAVSSSA